MTTQVLGTLKYRLFYFWYIDHSVSPMAQKCCLDSRLLGSVVPNETTSVLYRMYWSQSALTNDVPKDLRNVLSFGAPASKLTLNDHQLGQILRTKPDRGNNSLT